MKSPTKAGPDFICIGAQKAGTTWLYENLKPQTNIWLPPVKEIHYFNQAYPNPLIKPPENIPHAQDFLSRYKLPTGDAKLANYLWLRKYYRLQMTDDWYLSLFSECHTKHLIAGDITPAYSTLTNEGIQAVKALVHPDCRVFIILRDPVERAWSSLKMLYRWRGTEVDSLATTDIIDDIKAPGITLRTRYKEIAQNWQSLFQDRFAIFLYEDLVRDPLSFYRSILRFIGLNDNTTPRLLEKRIWADERSINMPLAVRLFLESFYTDEIDFLSQLSSTPVGGIAQPGTDAAQVR